MMFSGLPSLRACSVRISRSFFDQRRVELGRRGRLRLHRRDVHRHVLGQLVVAAFDFQQHAALARRDARSRPPARRSARIRVSRTPRASCLRARPSTAAASCPCGSAPAASTARRASSRPGPVASCLARSFASAMTSSCFATGADSHLQLDHRADRRLDAGVHAPAGLLRCCDPAASP